MTIYVDPSRHHFGRMIMCHMVGDTVDELHKMAERLGLRRDWFQGGRFPHYDVCKSKRALAIALGAVEITSKELVQHCRRVSPRTSAVLPGDHVTAVLNGARFYAEITQVDDNLLSGIILTGTVRVSTNPDAVSEGETVSFFERAVRSVEAAP